ncbi:DUF1285 domain-containing protein [Labrys wisconsinensis]|uniref:DUF1285 domain-containing protein n=1 Tax=Labrys wisconsinensis TaxID=425677 RepID=A0ABU0JH75_9HYPH|nr:DUF1285 domain-containing protein [Labrys wisconsinensis]MDQ0473629.1 hypothetical protein [Labrys wisconsinensis]
MSEPRRPNLDGLTEAARTAAAGAREPPPVHLWHPAFCGDIDMRIAADGTWYYLGSPIGRLPLVKLFASILRRDPERYVLVTPVERVGIAVEDAPFVAVEMAVAGEAPSRTLSFRTNVDDWTVAGPDHPLRFEAGASDGLKPYVHVRAGLWARVSRALFYDLVAMGETRAVDGVDMFGVASGGSFFAMAPAHEIGGAD